MMVVLTERFFTGSSPYKKSTENKTGALNKQPVYGCLANQQNIHARASGGPEMLPDTRSPSLVVGNAARAAWCAMGNTSVAVVS